MVPYGEPETTMPTIPANVFSLVTNWETGFASPTAPITFKEAPSVNTTTNYYKMWKEATRPAGNRKSRRTEAAKARKKKKNVKSRPLRK